MVSSKGGGFVFEDPETDKSRRSIPIRSHTIALLNEHRRKQLEEKMALGSAYQNYDLVFPSEIGTPCFTRILLVDTSRRYYERKAKGLPKRTRRRD
jgi:integrase